MNPDPTEKITLIELLTFFEKLGPREIGILHEHVRLWLNSLAELLKNLAKTQPGDTMLSEIHYWRDMARVLEACNAELKMPFVEFTVQVLLCLP